MKVIKIASMFLAKNTSLFTFSGLRDVLVHVTTFTNGKYDLTPMSKAKPVLPTQCLSLSHKSKQGTADSIHFI